MSSSRSRTCRGRAGGARRRGLRGGLLHRTLRRASSRARSSPGLRGLESRTLRAWPSAAAPGCRREAEPQQPKHLAGRAARGAAGGYQDGYRDGWSALDGFKQSFATQATAQLGALVSSLDAEFDGCSADRRAPGAFARHRAGAPGGARRTGPPGAGGGGGGGRRWKRVLLSARHITVHVHPRTCRWWPRAPPRCSPPAARG
jgi:hypothetical protein